MKKYFLLFTFILCAFCADAQIEEDNTFVRQDSLPSRQEMLKRARKDYGPWMFSVGGGAARWIAILDVYISCAGMMFCVSCFVFHVQKRNIP